MKIRGNSILLGFVMAAVCATYFLLTDSSGSAQPTETNKAPAADKQSERSARARNTASKPVRRPQQQKIQPTAPTSTHVAKPPREFDAPHLYSQQLPRKWDADLKNYRTELTSRANLNKP